MQKKIIIGIVLMLAASFVVGGFRIVEREGIVVKRDVTRLDGPYDPLNDALLGKGWVESFNEYYLSVDDGNGICKIYLDWYDWREYKVNNTYTWSEIVWR